MDNSSGWNLLRKKLAARLNLLDGSELRPRRVNIIFDNNLPEITTLMELGSNYLNPTLLSNKALNVISTNLEKSDHQPFRVLIESRSRFSGSKVDPLGTEMKRLSFLSDLIKTYSRTYSAATNGKSL